jgi:hypothetical protein
MTTPAEPEGTGPGKVRTWWHPLLAAFLRWQLGGHYELREEVPVGTKPLQIDILLLLEEQGELPEQTRKLLAGLVEHLNDFTLLELKSPSDTLRAGDFQTLVGYALLYRAQNRPMLNPGQLTLIVIAPRLTGPYRDELRLLGVTPKKERDGVWRLEGRMLGGHPMWVLETGVLVGQGYPVLSLFSPRFLHEGQQTYEELRQAGYTELVVYMAQQIQQFRLLGKDFAMQHLGSEDELVQVLRDIIATFSPEEMRDMLPPEVRFKGLAPEERLKGLAPEERLKGLAPEERLKGLTPEDRLKGLAPEELERLRELLLRQTQSDDPANPR